MRTPLCQLLLIGALVLLSWIPGCVVGAPSLTLPTDFPRYCPSTTHVKISPSATADSANSGYIQAINVTIHLGHGNDRLYLIPGGFEFDSTPWPFNYTWLDGARTLRLEQNMTLGNWTAALQRVYFNTTTLMYNNAFSPQRSFRVVAEDLAGAAAFQTNLTVQLPPTISSAQALPVPVTTASASSSNSPDVISSSLAINTTADFVSAAMVLLTPAHAADSLFITDNVAGGFGGLTWAFDAATDVLNITGDGTRSDYETMLKGVRLNITSAAGTNRSVQVRVFDGCAWTPLSEAGVIKTAANAVPAITGMETTVLRYGRNSTDTALTRVLVTSSLALQDANDVYVEAATVNITEAQNLDRLHGSVVGYTGVSMAWNTNTLTFSGIAHRDNYTAILNNITFVGHKLGDRRVFYQIFDRSGAASVPVKRTVRVGAAPHANGISYNKDGSVYLQNVAPDASRELRIVKQWSFTEPLNYALALYSLALPTGISVNSTTGSIEGVATVAAPKTNYTVNVTNDFGSLQLTFNLTVNAGPSPNITYRYQVDRAVFSNFTHAPTLVNSSTPITFTAPDGLPTGLKLDSTSGNITGRSQCLIPTAQEFRIRGTNTGGVDDFNISMRFRQECGLGFYSTDGFAPCTACPVGTHAATIATSACTNCSAGWYSAAIGQVKCVKCPKGRFSNGTRSSQCFDCAPGSFSDQEGTSVCTNCTEGSYTGAWASLSCTFCPVGTFTAISSQSTCTNCTTGRFCNSTNSTACYACAPGHFAGRSALSVCQACGVGRFGNGTALSVCFDCPPGNVTSVEGSTECRHCIRGRYAKDWGMQECEACERGRYNGLNAQSNCTRCAKGYYAPRANMTACVACAAGRFTNLERSDWCDFCPVGRFNNDTAMTRCFDCPKGNTTSSEGSTACTVCNEGYYAESTALQVCVACELGRAGGAKGLSTCTNCVVGKFANATAMSRCLDCAAGSYSPEGSAGCDLCPVGRFSNETGQSRCFDCPPGNVTDVEGSTSCRPCTRGRYAPSWGMQECVACERGRFSESLAQSNCTRCSIGYYAPRANMSACLQCVAGRFTNVRTRDYCDRCPVGRFNNDSALTRCFDCAPGAVSNQEGNTQCYNCTVGEYAETWGMQQCRPCNPGWYQGYRGKSSCVLCPLGRYQGATNSSTCVDCPTGWFAEVLGRGVCDRCPVGRFNNDTGLSRCFDCDRSFRTYNETTVNCSSCNPGYYAPVYGKQHCLPCEAGMYNDMHQLSACQLCPLGRFTPQVATTSCYNCSAGRFASTQGRISCDYCSVGRYSDHPGLSRCFDCRAGSVQAAENATSCISCTPGWYAPVPGMRACLPCPLGRWNNAGNMSFCHTCPKGRFGPTVNRTSCVDCAAGFFTAVNESIVCDACPIGWWNNATDATECFRCPVGRYNPAENSTVCHICAAGRFTEQESSVRCVHCERGRFNNGSDMSRCFDCAKGSYQPKVSQSSCVLTVPGYYAEETGLIDTRACPKGRFSGVNASSRCYDCQPGWHQPFAGSSVCLECVRGKFSNETAVEVCRECRIGRYNGLVNATNCVDCPTGKYQPAPLQSSCIDCAAGAEQQTEGSNHCLLCVPGKFGNVSGLPKCYDCGSGLFASGMGSLNCSLCPVGRFSDTPGALVCDYCAQGKFLGPADLGATSCSVCAAGKFANFSGASECIDCAGGYYAPDEGRAACTECDAGRFANTTGLSVCARCSPGYFQVSKRSTFCESCAPGFYTPNDGLTGCALCDAGSFANATAATGCVKCTRGRYQGERNASLCIDCAAGSHVASEGAESCVSCSNGRFQDLSAASYCKNCPQNSETYLNNTYCRCHSLYWEVPAGHPLSNIDDTVHSSSDVDFECLLCNSGGNCDTVGTTISNVIPSSGYFQSFDGTNSTFIACFAAEACSASGECAPEYRGNLCSYCVDGYGRNADFECTQCQDKVLVVLFFVAVLLGFAIFVGALTTFTVKRARSKAAGTSFRSVSSVLVKILISGLQFNSLALSFDFEWPYPVDMILGLQNIGANSSRQLLNTDCVLDGAFPTSPFIAKTLVMAMLPVVIMLLPPVVIIPLYYWTKVNMKAKWDQMVQARMDSQKLGDTETGEQRGELGNEIREDEEEGDFEVANTGAALMRLETHHLDFGNDAKEAGEASDSEDEKTVMVVAEDEPRSVYDAPRNIREDLQQEKTKHFHIFLVAVMIGLFLVHPALVQQSFEMYACKDLGDGTYVIKDLDMKCGSSLHNQYVLAIFVPMLTVYVLGIPLLTAYFILYRNREVLSFDEEVDRQKVAAERTPQKKVEQYRRVQKDLDGKYIFLYDGYSATRFYWELLVIFRKVILVIITVFFSEEAKTQALLAVFVTVTFLLLHAVAWPFANRTANMVEALSLCSSFVTFFGGLFLFNFNDDESELRITVSLCIAFANLIFVGVTVLLMIFSNLQQAQKKIEDISNSEKENVLRKRMNEAVETKRTETVGDERNVMELQLGVQELPRQAVPTFVSMEQVEYFDPVLARSMAKALKSEAAEKEDEDSLQAELDDLDVAVEE